MRQFQFLLSLLICMAGYSQLPAIYIAENADMKVNRSVLHTTDGKRCLLLNVFARNNTADPLREKAGVLLTVKLFYDSSNASTLYSVITKDSLAMLHAINAETLANKLQEKLILQLQQMLADSGTAYRTQYPWVQTLTARELILEKNGRIYRITGNNIYIQAFLITDFPAAHYRQTGMNIINTKAKQWTPPNNIYLQIPVDVYNMGRCLLTDINSDSSYHFVRIPPLIDDNGFDANIDEIDYKPGTGIVAFKSYYHSSMPLKRIKPDEQSLLAEKNKHFKPWNPDTIYTFTPSPQNTGSIFPEQEIIFDDGNNFKKMKLHQPPTNQ